MKKYIILTGTLLATTNTLAALSDLEQTTCYISSCFNQQTADSSCDSICSWCSGNVTAPAGYVYVSAFEGGEPQTIFTRQISTKCGDTTYSCVCGATGSSLALAGYIQCDTGYYGSALYSYTERYGDNFSGCYRCPSSGGVYGTTAGPGAISITECYLPAGTSFSDDIGSGTYSDDCYYSN
ncbi:MAG: hypothetical protein IJX43_01425 [Alphaproteobacteria bacterium]|nr:hypothetical protein [Alphaproteobacteria bacterium]